MIGFMGTGKSTVGKILAKKLGWIFVDSDFEIQRQAKNKIAKIIDSRGLKYFRKLESEIIAGICKNSNQVVALGGGSILIPSNRKRIRAAGIMIRLDAKDKTLFRRLSDDADRPLIRAKNDLERMKKIKNLYRQRQKQYKLAATQKFSTDNISPNQIANQVKRYVGKI